MVILVCQLSAEELDSPKPAAIDLARSGGTASLPAEERLRADMSFLTDDSLQGRGIGGEGIQRAADYIAQSFAASGLRVDSFAGTPFQTLDVSISATMGPLDHNRLVFIPVRPESEPQGAAPNAGAELVGELDRTFRPMAIGASNVVQAELAFVGYGITAPEYGYDDYAAIDAKDRVLIVMRKEPSGGQGNRWFEGGKNTKHAFFETKIKNAEAHGAAGVLFINDLDSIRDSRDRVRKRISDETLRLKKVEEQISQLPAEATNSRASLGKRREAIRSVLEDLARQSTITEEGLMDLAEAGEKVIAKGIPVVSLSRRLADQLLLAAGLESIDSANARIDQTSRPVSSLLRHRVDMETRINPSTAKSSNVVGVLDGKGPLAEQTVIVGAHYDHVGMGGYGSLAPGTIAVHNGADDNASGTATLLSSVQRIKERLADDSSHRRIVFIAFTGEERGLLGSEYYVRHPRFPLESTVAMINLDMVGRLRDNDLTVYGTGSAVELDAILEDANQSTAFKLFKVPSGYGPSDHQSFYMQKVPVLFFFTGLHNDYHRPSDDFDKINFNGLTRITDITSGVAVDLAIRPERPRYAETDRDVEIRWQASAYLGVQLRELEEGGVMISAVTSGGSADVAGLLAGDRLRKFDDVEIRTTGEVLEAIGTREVGDSLRVELQRGETILILNAFLQKRPN